MKEKLTIDSESVRQALPVGGFDEFPILLEYLESELHFLYCLVLLLIPYSKKKHKIHL